MDVSINLISPFPHRTAQMASCTLDASVKIYSCRVDSIHSEAYKVLGGFGRQEDAETEAGKGGAVDSDDEEAGAQGKTKRRVSTVAPKGEGKCAKGKERG